MNVTGKSVTTVTVELTEEEAQKLGGLLQAVPTSEAFFAELADQLDMEISPFLSIYTVDEDGVYNEYKEEV